ncbi:MAG: hypothetical protein RJA76_1839 [Bacteroidota bacterium]|jgi:hypothetical protein
MKWNKKGLIYCPSGKQEWNANQYAHVVCADTNYSDKIRLYYSCRDSKGRCQASFIDLDANDLSKVIYEHPNTILPLGKAGTFDDCGIMPTWFLQNGSEKWLYYIGWTVRNTIPYHNALGLAISTNGEHFSKKFEGPVISTTANEPYFNGSACFLIDQGKFKCWYLNCTEWIEVDGKMEPCYHLKYAESTDGIHWERNGIVAIDYKDDLEGGISRPSVLLENGLYKMWFSSRAKYDYRTNTENSYRIYYAESLDGIHWTRKDGEVGIDISENKSDWDSQMIEYPLVIQHKGETILFYNGNHFGKTGVGYAILEK